MSGGHPSLPSHLSLHRIVCGPTLGTSFHVLGAHRNRIHQARILQGERASIEKPDSVLQRVPSRNEHLVHRLGRRREVWDLHNRGGRARIPAAGFIRDTGRVGDDTVMR